MSGMTYYFSNFQRMTNNFFPPIANLTKFFNKDEAYFLSLSKKNTSYFKLGR